MTKHDIINDLLRLVDTPPSPEGDILPEYVLVFREGYLEGVNRSLKIIAKYENENENEQSGNAASTGGTDD